MSRLTGSLVAVVAAVASLSACGSGGGSGDGFADQSATKISDAAEADTKKAKSMRIKGTIDDDGQTIRMDIAVSTQGECKGTMAVQGQGSFRMVSAAGKTYIKPDEKFWRTFAKAQADQVMRMVGDKWADFGQGGFDELCDLDKLLDEAGKDDDGKLSKGKRGSVGGTDAIELVEVKGKEETHIWVATSAPHNLLKMCQTKPKDEGCVTFSDYDKPVGAKAPAKDQVVKLG